MYALAGACHCGNVRFRLQSTLPAAELQVRRCACTFCSKHACCYISDPQGELVVEVRDPALLASYRFGTRTADFFVCKECGVMPFVTSEIDGTTYAVVNANTLDAAKDFRDRAQAMDYNNENEPQRLERRRQHWIGRVRIAAK